MRALAVNCGSSSLKFRPSETSLGPSPIDKWLAWGVVVGREDRFFGPTLIDDEVVATIDELSYSALLITT